MNTLSHPHPTESKQQPRTLHLVANTIGVLAFVTGLLYGRVLLGEPLLLQAEDGANWRTVIVFCILLVTLMALFLTWRAQPLAWLLTIVGGMSLALIMYGLVEHNRWLFGFFYGSPFVVAGALFALDQYRDQASE